MNSTIEMLNLWGERFLTFTWPMLWQSSLLIVVLFAGDFVLRRRLRPAVRYTLWLVLLLKLLMPPSLALPTSVAWWLRANPQSPQKPAEPLKTFVVTYGDTFQSEPLPVVQHVERPRPKPSTAAWLLAGWSLGSVGLLGFLLIRWRQITGEIRQTESAPDWTEELFNNVRRELNCRQPVRLRLTNRAMSPAVCGFFRPTILLPRALIERLDPDQLRAVLLHELIHLRRGDVWVNCAQALIQVAYWWHPLLWLANARIRRVREEAVDDAVMLALRDNAENYAPTLLEVAKLAFSRPLASLGLVGILESRNALRQRIERLVNFRAPRQAGLTLTSALGVIAFAAIAAPMNKAPESVKSVPAEPQNINDSLWPDPHYPGYKNLNIEAAFFLIEESKMREVFPAFNLEKPGSMQMREDIDGFRRMVKQAGGKEFKPSPTFSRFSGGRFHWQINQSSETNDNQIIYQTQRIGDRNIVIGCDAILRLTDWSPQEFTLTPWAEGNTIRCEISTTGWGEVVNLGMLLRTNETGFWAVPNVSPGICQVVVLHGSVSTPPDRPKANASDEEPGVPNKSETSASSDPLIRTNAIRANEGRRAIANKLNNIKVNSISFDGVTLREALNALSDESKTRDPGGEGVNFTFIAGSAPMIDPNTGLLVDASLLPITIKPAITDARLVDVLPAIVQAAPTPVRYSIKTNAVAFFASSENPPEPLYTRTFKVNTNALYRMLNEHAGPRDTMASTNTLARVLGLFSSIGVELQPPKAVYFSDGKGTLLVRASLKDLDAIEGLLQVINDTPPQINIKVKYVEMPEESVNAFYSEWFGTNRPSASSWSGIMTRQQYSKAIQSFEKRKDTEIITGPEVTTLSGRQAQIQMVEMRTIVNGLTTTTTNGETQVDYKTSPIPFGPVLDVIPHVSADGYTIQLTAIPTFTEFLGYDDPKEFTTNYITYLAKNAQLPLPRIRVRQITTSAIVWDGQTLVLGNFSDKAITSKSDGTSVTNSFNGAMKKQLFVFITPTLIDPAGNRIHKEEEMPFARDGVPRQTK